MKENMLKNMLGKKKSRIMSFQKIIMGLEKRRKTSFATLSWCVFEKIMKNPQTCGFLKNLVLYERGHAEE